MHGCNFKFVVCLRSHETLDSIISESADLPSLLSPGKLLTHIQPELVHPLRDIQKLLWNWLIISSLRYNYGYLIPSFSMKHKYRKTLLRSLPILAVLAIPSWLYYRHFGKKGLSDKTSDWSNFGTFFYLLIATCNLYVFIWFTIVLNKYNETKDTANEQFQKNIERPVLIFKSLTTVLGEQWIIENIGNGAALNMRIGDWNDGLWNGNPVKGYSLGKGQNLEINWKVQGQLFCVSYEDVGGTGYVSIGVNDETYTTTLAAFSDISLVEGVFSKADLVRFQEYPGRRLHQARAGHP